MKKTLKIALIFLGIILMPKLSSTQVDFNKRPDDDLGNVEDKFQDSFFEALKQKGIENYDRAVKALLKCAELRDSEAVVYYELGKNYVMLKNFGKAEESLKKAINIDPNNEWYLDALYGVYVQINNYEDALKTVKKLTQFHPDYKQDLANFYFENKKYRLALKTLDELDEEFGISEDRDAIRKAIYNATGDDKERIEYLEERIELQPNNESNYLNLIYRYSERNNKKKAFETAIKLLDQKPNSQLVHLALYKFYLDEGNHKKAIKSMKIVVKSNIIKPDAKAMVLNDFVKFVRDNPQFEDDLLEVTTNVASDETGKSHAELGQFYLQKNNKEKALEQFKLALTKDETNFDIIKKALFLQIDLKKYQEAEAFSSENLELYPSQPILYLANGVANNNLNQPDKAIESLEIGVDYIIDNVIMEIDFYRQLSIAYKLSNNITKSNAFSKKADALLNKE
ncbi:MAG: tetratricopeptide repeat protein [Flavobacteriaceae bacterium]|nr:tetratricopeptide repeat protein [Flavobacteriaceae bacterium]